MIQSAARSLTDWPGFMNSALPQISQPVASDARRSRISGVLPTAAGRSAATIIAFSSPPVARPGVAASAGRFKSLQSAPRPGARAARRGARARAARPSAGGVDLAASRPPPAPSSSGTTSARMSSCSSASPCRPPAAAEIRLGHEGGDVLGHDPRRGIEGGDPLDPPELQPRLLARLAPRRRLRRLGHVAAPGHGLEAPGPRVAPRVAARRGTARSGARSRRADRRAAP